MNCRSGCPAATDSVDSRCDKVDRRWFQCPAASVAATQKPTSSDNRDLYASERVVVMFVQLKNYLGSYWLAPWFFVYIYPSILVYEWVQRFTTCFVAYRNKCYLALARSIVHSCSSSVRGLHTYTGLKSVQKITPSPWVNRVHNWETPPWVSQLKNWWWLLLFFNCIRLR